LVVSRSKSHLHFVIVILERKAFRPIKKNGKKTI
jgi:hypothetical protein